MNLIEIVRWPDGTWVLLEDFDYEKDWSHMSDDYEIVGLTEKEYEELM